jgi:hypothetical protein
MCFVWSAFNQVTYQLQEADSHTATLRIYQILWNPSNSDHHCSVYVWYVGKICDKKNPLTVVKT